jgi:hypothetical protein
MLALLAENDSPGERQRITPAAERPTERPADQSAEVTIDAVVVESGGEPDGASPADTKALRSSTPAQGPVEPPAPPLLRLLRPPSPN